MSVSAFGWSVGSVISSTTLILANKHILSTYNFDSPLLFAGYHFFMTWLFLEVLCRMGKIERANLPTFEKWFLAVVTCGGVVFMNLNLKFNSVGFYQLSKLAVVPYIVLYDFIVDHKKTPTNILCSLLLLLVGIALFSVNDLELNLFGSIIALIAVMCVATSQMKTGSYQREFHVSGPSLQHATAFQQFAIVFIAGLLTETHGKRSILNHQFCASEIAWIIATGFMAVSVNVCAFCLIGKTNAVTYQVVGHMKSILIFVFGLICFPTKDESTSQMIKKIIGLIIAMGGVVLYNYFIAQNKKKQEAAIDPPMKIEESENEESKLQHDGSFEIVEDDAENKNDDE